jgi:hypothetical protein
VLLVFRSAFELDANSSFLQTREDGYPDIAVYVGDFSVVSTVLKRHIPGCARKKSRFQSSFFFFYFRYIFNLEYHPDIQVWQMSNMAYAEILLHSATERVVCKEIFCSITFARKGTDHMPSPLFT